MAAMFGMSWPASWRYFNAGGLADVASRVGLRYAKFSERRPYVCAFLTSGSVLCSADITGQTLTRHDGQQHDWKRTIALTAWGMWHYGFPQKFWYIQLQRVFGQRQALMTFLDVYIWSPIHLIPSFYIGTGMIRGKTFEQCIAQLKNEWFEASTGTALFWTPLVWTNFKFVPQHSQILIIVTCSFLHKTWLSYLSNREQQQALATQAGFQAHTDAQHPKKQLGTEASDDIHVSSDAMVMSSVS